MEFSDLIKARYSVRAYKSQPVDKEKIEYVLDAARLAPTAANRQPFTLIVMKTAGREEELRRIYPPKWFTDAPLVIGICARTDEAWTRNDGKNYGDVDATIAMDHLILAAADLGLGTCWIAAFDAGEARKILGLPAGVEPVAFTPLGYPDDQPRQRRRKDMKDLVRFERW